MWIDNRLWTSISTNLNSWPCITTLNYIQNSKLLELNQWNYSILNSWYFWNLEETISWLGVRCWAISMLSVWRNQIITSFKVVNNCQKFDYSDETIKQLTVNRRAEENQCPHQSGNWRVQSHWFSIIEPAVEAPRQGLTKIDIYINPTN